MLTGACQYDGARDSWLLTLDSWLGLDPRLQVHRANGGPVDPARDHAGHRVGTATSDSSFADSDIWGSLLTRGRLYAAAHSPTHMPCGGIDMHVCGVV